MKTIENPTVALFLPALSDGGAEQVMVTLANAFAERNIRTHLVLGKAEGPYLAGVSNKVQLIDLGVNRLLKSITPLANYIDREKPDAILSTQKHANLIAVWAVKKASSKTRLILREPNVIRHRKGKPIKSAITHILMRRYYPLADEFVAVSKDVQEDLVHLIKLPPGNISTINNPVDEKTVETMSLASLRHPFVEDESIPLILALGRLNRQKNFPLLIDAFEKIIQEMRCNLIILGEGQEREKLENMIRQKNLNHCVDLPGFVTNPFPYMKHAEVIVSSSSWEGLPNVLIQALALGKKIVATNCPGGSAEILSDGRYGKLVKPNDPTSLAAAIQETIFEEANTAFIKERGKAFELQSVANEYLKLLLPDTSKTMNLLICGNFGHRTSQSDGQTYKTRLLHEELSSRLPEVCITTVDTSYITTNPLKVLSLLKKSFRSSDLLVMMPGNKGLQLFSFLFSRWRRQHSIPIHYVVIGGWLPEYLEKFSRVKEFCRSIDGVYVQTAAMKKKLLEMGVNNAKSLPNFRKFDRLNKRQGAGPEEPGQTVRLKACFYSRIIREKGIEQAMEAVEKINAKYNEKVAVLDIYGPIPKHYRQSFDRLLKKYPDQHYKGELQPENPYPVLADYDVMLFPTFYAGEGFPGAVLDAYIAGVPVIASDWRYNPEVVTQGETGLLFQTGQVNQLIEKMEQLLEDKPLLLKMKQQAGEHALQYHTDRVIPRLIRQMGICE